MNCLITRKCKRRIQKLSAKPDFSKNVWQPVWQLGCQVATLFAPLQEKYVKIYKFVFKPFSIFIIYMSQESSKMWEELISNAKARKVFYDTGKEEGRLKKILSAVNKSIS